VAEALPCIMMQKPVVQQQTDCMNMQMPESKPAAGMAKCDRVTVQDCFNLPAVPADAVAIHAVPSHDGAAPAILPAAVTPVALLGQNVVRPPPQTADRFTPTHQFLASLSRWLI
jgi:hypothetical protein